MVVFLTFLHGQQQVLMLSRNSLYHAVVTEKLSLLGIAMIHARITIIAK